MSHSQARPGTTVVEAAPKPENKPMLNGKQELDEVKRYAIQVGWLPATASVYYRNNDSKPHESTYSYKVKKREGTVTWEENVTERKYHVSVIFKWDGTKDVGDKDKWKANKRYERAAHLNVDAKTGRHVDTLWFDEHEFNK